MKNNLKANSLSLNSKLKPTIKNNNLIKEKITRKENDNKAKENKKELITKEKENKAKENEISLKSQLSDCKTNDLKIVDNKTIDSSPKLSTNNSENNSENTSNESVENTNVHRRKIHHTLSVSDEVSSILSQKLEQLNANLRRFDNKIKDGEVKLKDQYNNLQKKREIFQLDKSVWFWFTVTQYLSFADSVKINSLNRNIYNVCNSKSQVSCLFESKFTPYLLSTNDSTVNYSIMNKDLLNFNYEKLNKDQIYFNIHKLQKLLYKNTEDTQCQLIQMGNNQLPIRSLSDNDKRLLKHQLRNQQSFFKQILHLKILKYNNLYKHQSQLNQLFGMVHKLLSPNIIDLMLDLAGLQIVIISNMAYSCLCVVKFMESDFEFITKFKINISLLQIQLKRHVHSSYDFNHIILFINQHSIFRTQLIQSLEYPNGPQTNLSCVSKFQEGHSQKDMRSIIKNWKQDTPRNTTYQLKQWIQQLKNNAEDLMKAKWKCFILSMQEMQEQDTHINLWCLEDQRLMDLNDQIMKRPSCFDMRIDYHVQRCQIGKFYVKSKSFEEMNIFNNAPYSKHISGNIWEMIMIVGFGCGWRFYNDENLQQKENMQFDRAIVMIPFGEFNDVIENYNKQLSMFYDIENKDKIKEKCILKEMDSRYKD